MALKTVKRVLAIIIEMYNITAFFEWVLHYDTYAAKVDFMIQCKVYFP